MPRTSFVGMSPHIHFHWPDFGANLRGRNVAACRGRLAASPFVWCLFPVPPRDLRDCGQLTRVPCAGPRVFYKTRERALRKDCSIFWFGAHSFLSLLCSGISQTAIPGSFIQLLSRYLNTAGQSIYRFMPNSKAESIEMAASGATSTKTLRPHDIEVPSTSGTNDDQPQLLSPKSWRERRDAYQPPSRRQTNGTIDAEDYFVRPTNSVQARRHANRSRWVLATCRSTPNGLSSCECTAPCSPR
jgi:hypothetical protein